MRASFSSHREIFSEKVPNTHSQEWKKSGGMSEGGSKEPQTFVLLLVDFIFEWAFFSPE